MRLTVALDFVLVVEMRCEHLVKATVILCITNKVCCNSDLACKSAS
jgi:hypothetical protein